MIKREKSDECDCLDDISTALGRLISDIIMNVGAACHIIFSSIGLTIHILKTMRMRVILMLF